MFAGSDRILEVRVPNPSAEPFHGRLGILARCGEGVVRVPEERDVPGFHPFEDVFQRRRSGEIVMRLDEDRNMFRSGIVPELVEPGSDPGPEFLGGRGRLLDARSPAKYPHVGCAQRSREVDKSPPLRKLAGSLSRVRLSHPRRTADASDLDPAPGYETFGRFDAIGSKYGVQREIHGPLQSAQLDGSEAVAVCEIQDLLEAPLRASQRGKCDGQAGRSMILGKYGCRSRE